VIEEVESDDLPGDQAFAVPYYFDWKSSMVEVTSLKASLNETGTPDEILPIRPSFVDLPGLEQQLEQLSGCMERVNWALKTRMELLDGCVPILIHGPSGKFC